MRVLTEEERQLYNELVKFKRRHVLPYKCSMAMHPPEGFDKA